MSDTATVKGLRKRIKELESKQSDIWDAGWLAGCLYSTYEWATNETEYQNAIKHDKDSNPYRRK